MKFLKSIICILFIQTLIATAPDALNDTEQGIRLKPNDRVLQEFDLFSQKLNQARNNIQVVETLFAYVSKFYMKDQGHMLPGMGMGMGMDFNAIKPWIISPSDPSKMITLDTLAQLFSNRFDRQILKDELETYLTESQNVSKFTDTFHLLKVFTKSKLGAELVDMGDQFDKFFMVKSRHVPFPPLASLDIYINHSHAGQKTYQWQNPFSHHHAAHPHHFPDSPSSFYAVVDSNVVDVFCEMLAVRMGSVDVQEDLKEEFLAFQETEFVNRHRLMETNNARLFVRTVLGGAGGPHHAAYIGYGEDAERLSLSFQSHTSDFEILKNPQAWVSAQSNDWMQFIFKSKKHGGVLHPTLNFALATCTQNNGDESGNYPIPAEEIPTRTQVVFNNGQIFSQDSLLTEFEGLWVMGIDGTVRMSLPSLASVSPDNHRFFHHSFFYATNGIGDPIVCGGHMKIADGKIITIDNMSGHYGPSALNFASALKVLKHHNVLGEQVSTSLHSYADMNPIDDLLVLADSFEIRQ